MKNITQIGRKRKRWGSQSDELELQGLHTQQSHQLFPSPLFLCKLGDVIGYLQLKPLKKTPTNLSQPYFGPSVGVKPNTPKVGNLESSGTPECLELDSKAQNTLH